MEHKRRDCDCENCKRWNEILSACNMTDDDVDSLEDRMNRFGRVSRTADRFAELVKSNITQDEMMFLIFTLKEKLDDLVERIENGIRVKAIRISSEEEKQVPPLWGQKGEA